MDNQRMAGKTCLVTGASQGIGKETAIGLARLSATVVITARDRAKGERALVDVKRRSASDAVEFMLVDFASLDSIRQLLRKGVLSKAALSGSGPSASARLIRATRATDRLRQESYGT
jgi:NAD(P)-dependent dehydrogenase (short-subunit alcohol dehydrogenase family)